MDENFFEYGLYYFIISSTVTVFLAVIFNFIVKILINRFNHKYKDNLTTNQYLYHTIRAIVWLVASIIIIRQIKPLNSLGNTILGATSIIAIAVGIAAQATFGNYIAGFFLAIHQPFKVGDIIYIKERGLSGTVKEITFRHTILLTQEQTEIIIPNTVMNSAVVEDMSNGNYSRTIDLKIAGDTDLTKLQKIIEKVINKQELVLKKDEVKISIKEMIKDGFEIHFPVYTESLQDFVSIKNNMLPELYKELNKNKIKLL